MKLYARAYAGGLTAPACRKLFTRVRYIMGPRGSPVGNTRVVFTFHVSCTVHKTVLK